MVDFDHRNRRFVDGKEKRAGSAVAGRQLQPI
jgi:hypothetical protein